MKILLASDSHTDNNTLKSLAIKHQNCNYYLHLGDSQASKDDIHPFISVKGNCDYFSSEFERFLILFSPYGKIYAEHIPFFQTNIEKLKRDGFKIYLCGHTHIKKYEIIDGIHIINPGSIAYPRDGKSSYAIVDIDESSVKVRFYMLDK